MTPEERIKLEEEMHKLDREEERLYRTKSSHLMTSLVASGTGIAALMDGILDDEKMMLIAGTAILTLCLAYGIPAYKKNSEIDRRCAEMRKRSSEIYDILKTK